MCIQNNYNPLNLEFAFPKTSAKKFQTIELDLIDACQLKCSLCLRQERKDKICQFNCGPLSKLFKGKAGIDEIPTK